MLEPAPKTLRLALAASLVAGALLRAGGLWTDLWLDEIWNLNIARGFGFLDILLRVPYDANHILNTLWLRLVGAPSWWGVYRLHSLAAGVATIALAARIAARWGRLEAALAAAITAVSYLLTLYSSEARGHALMVCFALAAFLFLESWLKNRSRVCYAGWSACVWLGFLSHLMFIQAYAAFVLWSAWALRPSAGGAARSARTFGLLHLPGLAACAFVYLVQVRFMGHAGGPLFGTLSVVRETLAAALGCPDRPVAWAAGAAGLAAAAWAVRDLRRRGSEEWVFFAALVFALPLLLGALHPPGLLFPRYFLLAIAFAAVLGARAAAAGLRAGRVPAAAAAFALLLYGAGSLVRTGQFYRDGRGHYLKALRHIASSSGPETTVGSGHDFAHRMLLEFYAPYVPGTRFLYIPRKDWSPGVPEWAIAHEDRRGVEPVARLTALTGSRYSFERDFRSSQQVGWDWVLYRLERNSVTQEP